MAANQLSNGSDDGTLLGQDSSDKLGFYGLTTPIVRPTAGTAVATTVATSGASIYGFTKAQADAIVTAVNSTLTNLAALGLEG